MPIQITKLLEVINPQSGAIRESQIDHSPGDAGKTPLLEAPYPIGKYGERTIDPHKVDWAAIRLQESATGRMSTANFPDLLRAGVKFDVFSGFNERPLSYPLLVDSVPSSEPFEEYANDSGLGIPPKVAEGQPYPLVTPQMNGGIIIANDKYGYIIEITEELMKFDKWGKVRDTSANIGRSLRMGREYNVFGVLTSTGNYASVLNNNDQATTNHQTWTFGPSNLNKALAMMKTQKDAKSSQYLGVMPNTLVVGPLLEMYARTLISSPELMRVGGGTNDVYGGGTSNPFFGAVTRIVVSPLFSNSWDWALLDSTRALKFQTVEDISVVNEGMTITSESWLTRDVIRYKARDWYGVGMRDDRFAFLSISSTPPVTD